MRENMPNGGSFFLLPSLRNEGCRAKRGGRAANKGRGQNPSVLPSSGHFPLHRGGGRVKIEWEAGKQPTPLKGPPRLSFGASASRDPARFLAPGKVTIRKKNRLSSVPSGGDLAGNRTRDCAVRGRRLNRLTTRPYQLLCMAVFCQRFVIIP